VPGRVVYKIDMNKWLPKYNNHVMTFIPLIRSISYLTALHMINIAKLIDSDGQLRYNCNLLNEFIR